MNHLIAANANGLPTLTLVVEEDVESWGENLLKLPTLVEREREGGSCFFVGRWLTAMDDANCTTCRRHHRTSPSCISFPSAVLCPVLCVCPASSWHVCSELDGWLQGVRVRDVRRRRVSGQSAGLSPARARWQEDRPKSCIPSPSSPQGSILRLFFFYPSPHRFPCSHFTPNFRFFFYVIVLNSPPFF